MFNILKNHINLIKVKKIIKNKKICYLTGAGISIDSGIPPFRGVDGIYTKEPDLKYKLRPDTFQTDPEFIYKFHQDFLDMMKTRQPNIVHKIISKTANHVITQNIDDLHERGGFENTIHVHGKVLSVKCRSCALEYEGEFSIKEKCSSCNSETLRHNVVLFKESLINQREAYEALSNNEVLIMIGTSGNIYPVANYPKEFKGLKICINPEAPANVKMFDFVFIGNPEKILRNLFL